ncbi:MULTISPECIES: sugar ABC transporter permease [unclassified Paenibacillus]|uniref:carbohydrate ABC transporter permease n=1 Tax=unclassified Paenibacillus TaxID=185978 RepID=UPI001AE711F6|nr:MULTISPECIES: sugar ABC transporter permease [unclassified Paenibacillus]MBP1154436.1 raffinose/stachyose/melibiose transport system permease protein [Paenibacillus sp. PvP091]MBP1170180.1 raffinose/stachyose/melibiose transport system permease protein [Paenibacillus sp. PvR098]MBP2441208.1 raffinose/stachyose/melibiose transport system permease protein [Paenibacillus sp. PvP052]
MKKNQRAAELLQQLVFVGPALLFFTIIITIPFLMSIYYSFTEWNGVTSNVKWAGFDNFKQIILTDKDFHRSFWFTTRFTITNVILANVLGFLLALLLSQALKTKNVLRTVFFMPNVIGGLLLGFIWQFIFVKGFATIGELTNIAFFQLPWLGDAPTAFWGLIIVSVWQTAGYLMVIYIAGLSNVPKELTEAAYIDGANRFQTLRHITLPMIMPAVTVCLFLTISWAFKMYDLNVSLTQGGPFNSTQSVALNIYEEAFRNNRYGLGTAKAFIFFVIVALITLVQVTLTKKREVEV